MKWYTHQVIIKDKQTYILQVKYIKFNLFKLSQVKPGHLLVVSPTEAQLLKGIHISTVPH